MNSAYYNDDYETCAQTYATLRVYDIDPTIVSSVLGLEPNRTQFQGDKMYGRDDSPRYRLDGWFLTSQGSVSSRDASRHLDWLLDRLEPASSRLNELRDRGARMDVSCFWASASGHGGPTIPARLAQRLGAMNLELWFDVYFWNDPVNGDTA